MVMVGYSSSEDENRMWMFVNWHRPYLFVSSVVVHRVFQSVCGFTRHGLGNSLLTCRDEEASRKAIWSSFYRQFWLLRERLRLIESVQVLTLESVMLAGFVPCGHACNERSLALWSTPFFAGRLFVVVSGVGSRRAWGELTA